MERGRAGGEVTGVSVLPLEIRRDEDKDASVVVCKFRFPRRSPGSEEAGLAVVDREIRDEFLHVEDCRWR